MRPEPISQSYRRQYSASRSSKEKTPGVHPPGGLFLGPSPMADKDGGRYDNAGGSRGFLVGTLRVRLKFPLSLGPAFYTAVEAGLETRITGWLQMAEHHLNLAAGAHHDRRFAKYLLDFRFHTDAFYRHPGEKEEGSAMIRAAPLPFGREPTCCSAPAVQCHDVSVPTHHSTGPNAKCRTGEFVPAGPLVAGGCARLR